MIQNLQVVRAFAAIFVVIFHVVLTQKTVGGGPQIFASFDKWGASGVDLFFVLSGFIMIYIQRLKPKSPWGFTRARLERIVPIYWIITMGWAAVILVTSDFSTTYADPAHVGVSLLFLSKLSGFGAPFIQPGWTLELEMLFYCLFAVSLLLGSSFLVVGAALALFHFLFGLDMIVFEFFLGMLVGRWYFIKHPIFPPVLLAIAGMAALLYSLLADIETADFSRMERLLYWGIPSTFLIAGVSRMRQLRPGFLTLTGAASYSIYLSHWPGMRLFQEGLDGFGVPPLNPDMYVVLCTGFCVLLGLGIHLLIELPIARWLVRIRAQ